MPQPGNATSGPLRPDIQGLRAVAVGLVLVYHLWPNRLPGAFVGVDVFFVISGFLIGGHLLAELGATGRIRLGRFWARRARRLLPASLLVLLAVTVATRYVAPLSTREGFLHQVVGSTFYVQNWVLADQAVDYLALGDAPSPVQHYWSLSVEEQLYVGLPLVLAVGLLAARGRTRRWPVVLVAVLAVASLVWSMTSTASDPGIAYFSTLTRAWEFLAGTLLACLTRPLPAGLRTGAGAAGAVTVAVAAVAVDGDAAWPGSLALLPVLGTVLLLAAHDRGPLALLSRLRPVTWLGDVSYAVYLWHWPLVVLVPYATERALGTADKVGILLATLVLAAASTFLLELPVRTSPRLLGGRRARVVGAWALAASLVVGLSAAYGARTAGDEQEQLLTATRDRLADGDVRCLGAAALDPTVTGCDEPADLLLPPPSAAALDDDNRAECWATFGDAELHLCGFGSADPRAPRVLAVGDSHNNVYLPAYEELADALGWHIDVAGRAGCTWGTRPQEGRSETIAAECHAWKGHLGDHLAQSPPYDLILTTGDQAGYLAVPEDGESAREATVAGHSEAWAAEIARGTAVVAIRDYPLAGPDVVACVEAHGVAAATECARSHADAFPRFDALAQAVRRTPGSALVDLRDLMCTRTSCPPVLGHVVVYRNRDHLTATFVRTLAPYLVDRVAQAVPALDGRTG